MKAYRFRAYPNKLQIEQINQTAGCCRFVYNYFLDQKIKYYEENGESLSYTKCSRFLTKLKHTDDYLWLCDAESTALIQSLRDLDMAYKNFFKHGAGFPKFKSKHRNNCKYRSENVDDNIRFEDNRLRISKFGFLKVKGNHIPKGRILSSSIEITKTGKCFVSLCCDEDVESKKRKSNKESGYDLGLKDFLVCSNGSKYNLPKEYFRVEKLIKKEQRRLSRMELSNIESYKLANGYRVPVYRRPLSECKNYQKQRVRLARLYERRNNIKKDFFIKLSVKICSENQTACFEDLSVRGILKNHRLSRRVSDVSWSSFMLMLENQARKYDTKIIRVGRYYPSSRLCSCCGYKKIDLKLKDRSWTCPICNTHHDRDVNAAINILNEGTRTIRQMGLACGDDVRLHDNLLPKAVVSEAGSELMFALG